LSISNSGIGPATELVDKGRPPANPRCPPHHIHPAHPGKGCSQRCICKLFVSHQPLSSCQQSTGEDSSRSLLCLAPSPMVRIEYSP
jgi:hypothetical protein